MRMYTYCLNQLRELRKTTFPGSSSATMTCWQMWDRSSWSGISQQTAETSRQTARRIRASGSSSGTTSHRLTSTTPAGACP